MSPAIWWIRRDLRLNDNQALTAAITQADQVIPLFILDPALWRSAYSGDKRRAFLLGGLRQLAADLSARGSRLLIRQGEPRQVLAHLLAESGAEAIFAEADFSPYARQRDQAVAAALPLRLTGGVTARPARSVLKGDGQPYTVYTPYSKKRKSLSLFKPGARGAPTTPSSTRPCANCGPAAGCTTAPA